MVQLRSEQVVLMILCVLEKVDVSAGACTLSDNYKCLNTNGVPVGMCLRTKKSEVKKCYTKSVESVFYYKGECTPSQCRADMRNFCFPGTVTCYNGGKCINIIGSYTCACENSYHGRNCNLLSDKGKKYVNEVYLFYSPFAATGINNALILVREKGYDLKIVFSASSSGEVINVSSQDLKLTNDAKSNCRSIFKNPKVSAEFCKDGKLPKGRVYAVTLHYDVVYSSEGGIIVTDYNKKLSQPSFPGSKVNSLELTIYNGVEEEFRERFNQTTMYSWIKACPTPVKFENCGSSSDKPLRFSRKRSVLIRSSVEFHQDCEPTEEEKAKGNVPTRGFFWEIYNYNETWFKKAEPILKVFRNEFDEISWKEYKIKPFQRIGEAYFDFGIYKVVFQINSAGKSKVFGSYDENTASYQGVCFIELYELPLFVEIKGGTTRTVSDRDAIMLDGSKSHDPNLPLSEQTHLQWFWSSNVSGVACTKVNEPRCEVAGKLTVGEVVEFTLSLSTIRSSKSAKCSQNIIVSSKPQAQLEIVCRKNCAVDDFKTNPKEVLYLEVIALNGPSLQTFLWSSTNSCFVDEKETVEKVRQRGVDSRFLIVPKNSLREGSLCTFTVKVEVGEGSASIDIAVNKSPEIGNCSVFPENGGKKGITEFIITCASFKDGNAIEQLNYEFYQKARNEKAPGSLIGFSVTGKLEKVILTAESITIRVSDLNGMYTDVFMDISLDESPLTSQNMMRMVSNLTTSVSEGDRLSCARIAGGIVDLMDNVEDKLTVTNNILDTLNTVKFSDFSDVKLFSSTLNRIVSKGVPKLKSGLNSMGVRKMGKLMSSLALRLLKETKKTDMKSSLIAESDVKDIGLTMLSSNDAIVSSGDRSSFNGTTGSSKMFESHYQYQKGTARMVNALSYTGKAVMSYLLPHEEETVIQSNNTLMWLKVDDPIELVGLSGIPGNTTQGNDTKIKLSEKLGKFIKSKSNVVAVEATVFQNNPYWWDVGDKDVVSEIASLRVWDRSSTRMEPVVEIPTPVDIHLKINSNSKIETLLTGNVTMPSPSDSEDQKDFAVAVHTLEAPEENSNGKIFFEFVDLQGKEFRVSTTTNLRPDYEMMTSKEIQIVSDGSPSVSLSYDNLAANTLHFIGILPGANVPAKTSVSYSIKMYSVQCKVRQTTVWTSPACTVGEETADTIVHCKCSHMSFFGSSIFVAPNTVHPIKDLHLFTSLHENPLVFSLVIVLLIVYLLLLLWVLLQDRKDKLKRKVIVLQDNYPGDEFSYLIVVYTAINIGAATGSNVGIELVGDESISRAHILRSEHREVFRRNADDWFLLFTPFHLGSLEAIHVWHDNSGKHPDWYCKKIKVYDITNNKEYIFLVNQWMSTKSNEYIEALERAAKPCDVYDWRSVVLHNVIYNFQEKHLWLSVFASHPRATVSKSQRLTMAFCIITVAFLTGIMFYGVARGDNTEDDDKYAIKVREVVIAVESAVISTIATSLVVTCFKRSQVIVPNQPTVRGSNVSSSREKDKSKAQEGQKTSKKRNTILKFLCKSIRNSVRGKPLMPVLVGKESSESVIRRKRWATAGWVISQIIIWGSSFFIVLYGLKLGKVISELWVTSAAICFVNGIFLSAPLKILAFSAALALFGEMYDVTTFECDLEGAKLREQFGDEEHLVYIIKMRSSPVYQPLSGAQVRELRYKSDHLNRKLQCFEFIATIVFLVFLFNFTRDLWRERNFYINTHVELRLTSSLKTRPIGLQNIINIDKLTDYIIDTLLPNLYREKWYNKDKLTSSGESLESMGWVSDTVHRLVGVPQLRQFRVKVEECSFVKLFNVTSAKCFPSLSQSSTDFANYSLAWGPLTKYVNKPLVKPFTYEHAIGDGSTMYGASGEPYDCGGYIVGLEDTQKKCNLIISDLIDNSWWDVRTRAFIVEFSLYNPNTDSHSLVTIITEHLASGAVTNRVQTLTVHISFQIFSLVLFLSVLVMFNFRLLVYMNRHGFFTTLSHFWGRYDVFLIGLSDATAIFQCVKIVRAATTVEVFQQYGGSNFFYFSNIVFYERLSIALWCAVVVLAPMRIVKFNIFVSTCKAACYTIFKCRKLLMTLSLIITIAVIVQLFVVNFSRCPTSPPFDIDTKFYKTNVNTSLRSDCSTTSSLMFAVTCNIALVVLQVVLLHTYKIMSNY